MINNETQKLTRNQVVKLLSESECIRIPSLDIGGIFESYQLPDGQVLVDFAGEGGTVYKSRSELEDWLREAQSNQTEFNSTLLKPYTVMYDKPLDPSSQELEQLGFSENYPSISDSSVRFTEEKFELNASDKSYVISFIRYFRPLGFYEEYENFSESKAVEKLAELWATEVGFPFDSSDPYIDLFLLQWSFSRVWWQDVEADVCMGNEVYSTTVERWSRISRGAFLAESITELWESSQGGIRVHLTVNSQDYCLHPQVNGDWLDLDIVNQINALIIESRYQFEIVQTGMQIAFVTVLTALEKQQLQSERGWFF